MDWLRVHRGDAPLVIAFPHGGTDLAGLDDQLLVALSRQLMIAEEDPLEPSA